MLTPQERSNIQCSVVTWHATSGPCVMTKEGHVSPHGGVTCHMDSAKLNMDLWEMSVTCYATCHTTWQ